MVKSDVYQILIGITWTVIGAAIMFNINGDVDYLFGAIFLAAGIIFILSGIKHVKEVLQLMFN